MSYRHDDIPDECPDCGAHVDTDEGPNGLVRGVCSNCGALVSPLDTRGAGTAGGGDSGD